MQSGDVLRVMGMSETLGVTVVEESPNRVVMEMPVREELMQPFGYLHGGATIALLESAASWAACLNMDYEHERAFGTHVDVHHIQSTQAGTVRGIAEIGAVKKLGDYGVKRIWSVRAEDDRGNTLSIGTFTTRTVTLEYLEKKRAEKA